MRFDLRYLCVLLMACCAGCAAQRTTLRQSAVDLYPTADEELDFLDHVASLKVVTNHDALHGLIMLDADEEVGESYEERVAYAVERGWIATDAAPAPNESARVGMIAIAICDVLEFEGGLTMQLFGPSPRYCTRELVYQELIPMRSEKQSLSGLEFIDLIDRVENRMPAGMMTPVFDTETSP